MVKLLLNKGKKHAIESYADAYNAIYSEIVPSHALLFHFFAGKYLMRMHAPGFNATVDFPASAYYEELLRTFPKAKVVLSVRDNGEKWARSFITLMAFHVSILRTWIRAHVYSIRVALMCLPPRKPRSVRKSHTHCSGPLRCAPHCSVNI